MLLLLPRFHTPSSMTLALLTDAALSVRCGLVTGVTGALVSSHHVDALAILAQVVAQLALIHI